MEKILLVGRSTSMLEREKFFQLLLFLSTGSDIKNC